MYSQWSLTPHADAARHFEAIAVILCKRLEHLEDLPQLDHSLTDDPADTPAVIGVQQTYVDMDSLERAHALERIHDKIKDVSDVFEIVHRHISRQGEMVDQISINVDAAAGNIRAAERSIVRKYYPVGYVEPNCCHKRLVVQLVAMWVCLMIVFFLAIF